MGPATQDNFFERGHFQVPGAFGAGRGVWENGESAKALPIPKPEPPSEVRGPIPPSRLLVPIASRAPHNNPPPGGGFNSEGGKL